MKLRSHGQALTLGQLRKLFLDLKETGGCHGTQTITEVEGYQDHVFIPSIIPLRFFAARSNARVFMKFALNHKATLFVLLVAVWLLPGLIGRDPWKADEAYTYGLVLHIIETGDHVVPTLAGEPFLQKPPLFFSTAVGFVKALTPWFPFETAVHGANVVFLGLTLIALGLACREILGAGKGWYAAVVFMGCIGQCHTLKLMITDVSLVAGFAVALYGLAITNRKAWLGGLITGTGIGITFMSKGLFGPGLIGVTMLALLVFKEWRTKAYFKSWITVSVAVLPWLLIWPILLYQRSPQLFGEWFLENNLGRFLGHDAVTKIGEAMGLPFLKAVNTIGMHDDRYIAFFGLPMLAFPAIPLAVWIFWKERGAALRKPGIQLALMNMLVITTIVTMSRNGRELYEIPALAAAALLGAQGIDLLTEKFARGWRKFTLVAFGIVFALIWLAWVGQFFAQPSFIWNKLHAWSPEYVPVFQVVPFLTAALFTVGWLVWMLKQPQGERSLAAVNWAVGLCGAYLFLMTIWLPLMESRMSYRHLTEVKALLPEKYGCISSSGLGEPQRAMFHYYAGVKTTRIDAVEKSKREEYAKTLNCEFFLMEYETFGKRKLPEPPADQGPWKLIWEDMHSGKELFRLYQKQPRS